MSDFNRQYNRAVWFDIPVADLGRAAAFYSAVLGVGVNKESYGDFSFCVIDHHDGNGGCLVKVEAEIGANHEPKKHDNRGGIQCWDPRHHDSL